MVTGVDWPQAVTFHQYFAGLGFQGGTMMVRGLPVQWFSSTPLVSKVLVVLCPVRCCTE